LADDKSRERLATSCSAVLSENSSVLELRSGPLRLCADRRATTTSYVAALPSGLLIAPQVIAGFLQGRTAIAVGSWLHEGAK
jgi:hypothetical protein